MKKCIICNGDYYTTVSTGVFTYDLCCECFSELKEHVNTVNMLWYDWWREMICFDSRVRRLKEESD